ncbi:MAG: LysE family translocator [Bacteroidetes bacterium]|nr:MAG: LysE family translocator [Bacteroidota bacterium]MBL1144752.1 LysE family translocator [Bacteroidota bacterium]NOG57546.1 LysE family translocator [Bacteroidota bacterium]
MELSTLFAFALASFFMALMPGPDNIYVITESISKGFKNGILLSFGLNSGVLVHTLAAATGLSLILKQSELAFLVMQYLGALYLLYMAWGAYKEQALTLEAEQNLQTSSQIKVFRTGFLMNVLNPKVSLFFIAFLPQFVNTNSSIRVSMQMISLGFIFMLIGFLTFSTLAVLAAQLRKPLSSPLFWKVIKWTKVIVLLSLSAYLILNN